MLPILSKLSKRFLAKKPSSFKRFLFQEIDFKASIIGIKGARGSGKTTLLHQYAKRRRLKSSQILYISCDHPAMLDQPLYEIADAFYAHGGRLLILDEIHKAKNFSSHIKAMYDFTNLQVLFSGSSAIRIESELADLSRRALIYHLPVLSFREFLALSNIAHLPAYDLSDIITQHEDIVVDILEKIKGSSAFGVRAKHF